MGSISIQFKYVQPYLLDVFCGLFIAGFKSKSLNQFAQEESKNSITAEASKGELDVFERMRQGCSKISLMNEERKHYEEGAEVQQDALWRLSSPRRDLLILESITIFIYDLLESSYVSQEPFWVPQGGIEQGICDANKKVNHKCNLSKTRSWSSWK